MRVRAAVACAAGISLALGIAGCGGSAGGAASAGAVDDQLKGANFTVSSKDFTESIVLGKIAKYLLQAHGATVADKTNIQGSVNTRTALTSGQVDMYWEYTGTGWITYLKKTKPLPDPQQQYQQVKEADDAANGIAWLPPAPLNDTYAFAVQADRAKQLNVHTLSDLARLSRTDPADATLCVESEFSTRDDGLPGVTKTYGLQVPQANVKMLDPGVIYTETQKGKSCNFGEVNSSTDGRIAALNLVLLNDDKRFFPFYNPSLTLKKSLLAKYPALAGIFAPVAAKLDNKTMTDLNTQVDVQGNPADQVALQWLKDQGFAK